MTTRALRRHSAENKAQRHRQQQLGHIHDGGIEVSVINQVADCLGDVLLRLVREFGSKGVSDLLGNVTDTIGHSW